MNQHQTEHPITALQLGMLVFMLVLGVASLASPSITSAVARQDAWISLLASQLFGLLATWMYAALIKRSQGLNWIPLLRTAFPPWMGTALGMMYVLYNFLLTFTLIYFTSVFLSTYVLPETPIITIQVLLVSALAFGMYLGFYTIARSAQIIFPWVLSLMSILFIFSIPDMKIGNLLPVLDRGVMPVLQGMLTVIGIPNLELFLLLSVTSLVRDQKKIPKMLFRGMIFGNICILIITLLTLLVLGAEQASISVFAGFELARRIHIGEVFQRIEVVVGGFWILSIYFNIAVCYYAVLDNLKDVFKLANYRFMIVPISLLLIIFSLSQYPSFIFYAHFVNNVWYLFHLVIGLLIPFTALLMMHFKVKRKKRSK
ncbi:GerAB/ArcD/ProY family transporter [Marinicrinis lubricantis]|uniref:Endospore germination permease n=1 Tax=Marinicrinis lubricantis TaxID=2086470 RepID=A0ABW1IQ58_9BACL